MYKTRKQYVRAFQEIDKNGDGKISPWELHHHCVITNLPEHEAEVMVKWFDSNGDDLFDLNDFIRIVEDQRDDEKLQNLKEAFRVFAGEEEKIIPKSLRRLLSRLGESRRVEKCEVMICQFDIDGDGVLCFDEFMVMMQ